MTSAELFKYLIEDAGLDAATADVIMKAAANEKVGTRAAALVQKREYDDLERRAAALELSYNGTKDKPGAKVYEDWYTKNAAAIQKLQTDAALYKERFGDLNAPDPKVQQQQQAATFTAEDVEKIVHKTIQSGGYADRWSELLTGTGEIVQKHMFAGRKTPIDFKKLSEIAAAKNGNLVEAYNEYDAPEREASAKAATEAEIQRRVNERVQAMGTDKFFPADATPSTTGITKASGEKSYDRNKVIEAAVSGKYEPAVN